MSRTILSTDLVLGRPAARACGALMMMVWLAVQGVHAQGPRPILSASAKDQLYFPTDDAPWATVNPQEVGWDSVKLRSALDWAGDVGSTGVVILLNGKILAEAHGTDDIAAPELRLRLRLNERGHSMEDVASVQKSVTSLLVGLALQNRLLELDDSVSKHLGVGWSKASETEEARVKILHLLTMTSGLSDRLEVVTKPGSRWRYNTPAYSKVRDCVVAASGKELNELTRQWLTGPLGMDDSRWMLRPAGIRTLNAYGFVSTARDLAKLGLFMQASGRWGQQKVFADSSYLDQATSPSQQLKPSYGFLWWLNGKGRVEAAPRDMYSANGAKTRRLFVMPTRGLVITRIGVTPKMKRPANFDTEFCRRILAADTRE